MFLTEPRRLNLYYFTPGRLRALRVRLTARPISYGRNAPANMRNLKAMILFLTLLLASNPMLKGQANSYDLMPQPAEISAGEGRLVIDGGFRVAFAAYHAPKLKEEAVRLLRHESRLQLAAA